MAIDQKIVLAQLDELLIQYQQLQGKYWDYGANDYSDLVQHNEIAEFTTRVHAAVLRTTGADSSYMYNLQAHEKAYKHTPYLIDLYGGVLKGLRADFAAGYLQSITELNETWS